MTPPTPASLIEDAYATDLVPWWRYLVSKFRRRPRLHWTTVMPKLDGTYVVMLLPDNFHPEKAMAVCHVCGGMGRIWGEETPLDDMPENCLWYGPIPLPTK